MTDPGHHAAHRRPAVERADVAEVCSVCPHAWAAHDALGARFCAATLASARTRGCICRPTRGVS